MRKICVLALGGLLSLVGCATLPAVNSGELSDVSPVVNALKEELQAYAKCASPPVNVAGQCVDPQKAQYDLFVQNAAIDLNTKDSLATTKSGSLPAISPLTFAGASRTTQRLISRHCKSTLPLREQCCSGRGPKEIIGCASHSPCEQPDYKY
ncbi:MAG: hypothetical protein EON56_02025 [Alphaproteobacteria bacterium]|nr:MAG: hypothetical protein EON56_02025 [Alphaproteobacteria bacterium]